MSKSIIFLHPDLGVGGAERLVVDAAIALKINGYNVRFITSYHNKEHCFEETKNDTLKVTVVGDWIPRNFMGRFYALFAYLKMIYCALYILLFEKPDLIFCDLVSVCIPILHLSVKNVIYYCHYPDQLLSKKEGLLKRLYRIPLNWVEEITINCADKIYVNSEFTKKVYQATFKSFNKVPTVLYPSINTRAFDEIGSDSKAQLSINLNSDNYVFLSINRYERKKHIEMAIKALKCVEKSVAPQNWDNVILIIAGGYDPRVKENVEYFKELTDIVDSELLKDKVIFLKSPSDSDKINMLKRCNCLIYTPPNEHFGIVPLEAMYCKKPVIACNSGGPTETIINRETGMLCEFNVEDFAKSMLQFCRNNNLGEKMGEKGYERFKEKFSFEAFSHQLSQDVEAMIGRSKTD